MLKKFRGYPVTKAGRPLSVDVLMQKNLLQMRVLVRPERFIGQSAEACFAEDLTQIVFLLMIGALEARDLPS